VISLGALLRRRRFYNWECDQAGCERTVRSLDRAAFRVDVLEHRKAHVVTDPDCSITTLWEDSFYRWSSPKSQPPGK
jgi:hypothetical protein